MPAMNNDLLDLVCWNGFKNVRGPVRGIILRFHGLGHTGMKTAPEGIDHDFAAKGGLVIEVYQDPWGWMNDTTRDLFDDVVSGLRARHNLAADLPLIATGGSMGGHAALAYCFKSKHRVTACATNCPVADLDLHYTERPDLPRTIMHAYGYRTDIRDVLKLHSPVHQVARMPDIPYLIIHGLLDKAVAKHLHSDPLIAGMRKLGRQIEYIEEAEMGHCGPMSMHAHERWREFVIGHLR
jgi:dipeptidyl aminopeptidase/acylaminoacyl peptidase